jgi:hypothetical protein
VFRLSVLVIGAILPPRRGRRLHPPLHRLLPSRCHPGLIYHRVATPAHGGVVPSCIHVLAPGVRAMTGSCPRCLRPCPSARCLRPPHAATGSCPPLSRPGARCPRPRCRASTILWIGWEHECWKLFFAARIYLARHPPRSPELPQCAMPTCLPRCNIDAHSHARTAGVLILHGKTQVFLYTMHSLCRQDLSFTRTWSA